MKVVLVMDFNVSIVIVVDSNENCGLATDSNMSLVIVMKVWKLFYLP